MAVVNPNGANAQPRHGPVHFPRAQAGPQEVERVNGRLTPLGCPVCKGAEFIVSVSELLEVHLECCTCPPAPAVKLTVDHLVEAMRGR